MDKKIAVLGTGANGSCVAADLTNAGLDVVVVDQWPAHVEAMRANGVHVTLRQGEIHAKVAGLTKRRPHHAQGLLDSSPRCQQSGWISGVPEQGGRVA
ncbi:MAG: hypothetical protein JO328_16820 [Hyphomicrobiales bacterium]|nr:hypothetical protein [Hyphomicrobiales bacterium]MBV8824111.1 hypothetical protein [Hyphomicrobiales bacterium]MBV9428359.1 hypothetical protein [Bradyrhizobiaceae bacterium]